MKQFTAIIFLQLFFLFHSAGAAAQQTSFQYPGVLSNSFFGVSIGYINYPFSNAQMQPGFHAESVLVPHVAVRIILFGHQFNDYLSAQITYMRPVNWVEYKNVNNDSTQHSVWMNVAGFSVKAQSPEWKKFSVYGEGGLAVITRRGFWINDVPAVKHANYAGVLAGAGLQYHLTNKWTLMLNAVYASKSERFKHPHTVFYSGAFIYTLKPIAKEIVERNEAAGFHFTKNVLQFGITTNALGYGVNNAVSKGPVPIFWGGDVQIRKGLSINYQRNLFHSRKVFSLDWGANIGYWQSRKNRNDLFTVTLFPMVRFTAFRSAAADIYFNYSVAGPTYISRIITDGNNTGAHFTFQDFMGMGTVLGKNKNMNAEIRIMHYSNGNIYPENVGYMIPLTFNIGYAF